MDEPRIINLFCPSVSKLTQLLTWEEQKLDLGSIARAFGLDPSTVRINGHFISRGMDHVSSSVTWRSMLKFFSAKGLPTGKDNKDVIIVDGKLCKIGKKRSYESEEEIADKIAALDISVFQRPSQGINLAMNKKLRDNRSVPRFRPICNTLGFKRKHSISLQDLSFLKKLRINESNSAYDQNHLSSSLHFQRPIK